MGTPAVPKSAMRKTVSFADQRVTLDDASRPAPSRAPYGGAEVSRQASTPWILPRFSIAGAADTPKMDPAEPTSGAEEKAAYREKCAALLVSVLPPFSLKCEGGKGSSLPDTCYEAAATRMVVGLGGTAASASNTLRLFLRDWSAWRAEYPPPFPITTADAIACRNQLRDDAQPTAADRVPEALRFAHELGLPVEYEEGLFAERNPRAPAGPPKAREAPPPSVVVAIAAGACDPGELSAPVLEKARETYVLMIGASRGGGLHDSSVASFVDGAFGLVVSEDKLGRKDVELAVPALDLRTGEPLEWAPEFARERIGLPFFLSGWVKSTGKGGASIMRASVLSRTEDGRLAFCTKRVALKGVVDVMPALSGWSESALADAKLTGTHWARHLAGEVTELLRWPEPEANVVGDWTTATAVERAAGAQAGPAKKRGRGCTRKRYYAPNASRVEQIRIRARYVKALAAGLSRLGADDITKDTSWEDVFPYPPPEGLEWCYGADGGSASPPQDQLLLQ